jgi:hypothetical protein
MQFQHLLLAFSGNTGITEQAAFNMLWAQAPLKKSVCSIYILRSQISSISHVMQVRIGMNQYQDVTMLPHSEPEHFFHTRETERNFDMTSKLNLLISRNKILLDYTLDADLNMQIYKAPL